MQVEQWRLAMELGCSVTIPWSIGKPPQLSAFLDLNLSLDIIISYPIARIRGSLIE